MSNTPIRGSHNPGAGGWPTIKYFNKETGPDGGTYQKVTPDAMCTELGDLDHMINYIEGYGKTVCFLYVTILPLRVACECLANVELSLALPSTRCTTGRSFVELTARIAIRKNCAFLKKCVARALKSRKNSSLVWRTCLARP